MKFFENAREGKNHWIRYVAVILIGYTLCQIPATIYLIAILLGDIFGHNPEATLAKIQNIDSFLNTIPGFVVIMLTFATWMASTWLFFKWLHKRERMTLISGEKKLRMSCFLWGMISYGVFIALIPALEMRIDPDCYTANLPGSQYYLFLLLAIILVPFQTGCEELIFRSYLMQGFALCTKSKGWALVITSVAFGLLHCANNEIVEYGFWKMIPVYILIGFSLGFFAILTDGIEFSWGMHFINNMIGLTVFSNEGGTMNGNSLFVFKHGAITFVDYIMPVAFTAIIYFALRKKMGWDIRKAFDNSGLKPIATPVPPPYHPTNEM